MSSTRCTGSPQLIPESFTNQRSSSLSLTRSTLDIFLTTRPTWPKPLIQWLYVAARNPTILVAITPEICLSHFGAASATSLHCIYSSATTRLESTADTPRVYLMAADNYLFSVYQDWMQQNTGTHLDGCINYDCKW